MFCYADLQKYHKEIKESQERNHLESLRLHLVAHEITAVDVVSAIVAAVYNAVGVLERGPVVQQADAIALLDVGVEVVDGEESVGADSVRGLVMELGGRVLEHGLRRPVLVLDLLVDLHRHRVVDEIVHGVRKSHICQSLFERHTVMVGHDAHGVHEIAVGYAGVVERIRISVALADVVGVTAVDAVVDAVDDVVDRRCVAATTAEVAQGFGGNVTEAENAGGKHFYA
jgi:hypothetical protein